MIKKLLLIFFVSLLAINLVCAGDDLSLENQFRLSFGHILLVQNIYTEPAELIPGNPGALKVSLLNTGNQRAFDIRTSLVLPAEISAFNDVSEKRIAELSPGNNSEIEFKIVPFPKTAEGIYKADLIITYVNYLGQERVDNYSIGILVKSHPGIFATVEKSDIYSEKRTGDITIDFTNDNIADIKFLTITVEDSEDFDLISSDKVYVGDLDSGDYQSEVFTLNVEKNVKEAIIPLNVTYKDSLNLEHSERIEVPLKIRTAKELGIASTNYYFILLVLVVIIGLIVYFFKDRIFKKRK